MVAHYDGQFAFEFGAGRFVNSCNNVIKNGKAQGTNCRVVTFIGAQILPAAIGFPVLRLIRYRVASWTIDQLPPGAVRVIDLGETGS